MSGKSVVSKQDFGGVVLSYPSSPDEADGRLSDGTHMAQRIDQGMGRGQKFTVYVDGRSIVAYAGESVAAAMLAAGVKVLRTSPRDRTPRGAFCLMGSCQECLVRIEGRRQLACQHPVSNGLSVQTMVSDD